MDKKKIILRALNQHKATILVAVLIALIGGLVFGGVITNRTVITPNLITQIAFTMIMVVSLNLVVGFLGELSLGHAGFMYVGAYVAGVVIHFTQNIITVGVLRFIVALLCGGLAAAIFGFIIGLPALRLRGDYLAIVTLEFGEIIRGVLKNIKIEGLIKNAAVGFSVKKYAKDYTEYLFIIALVLALVTVICVQNLIRSKHGRAITAIRDNEIAARAMGINVTYYKLFVFVVAAFFAGVAGVMYGFQVSPIEQSFFSYNYSIEILVMVVLGGMGSIGGSIAAATLITYVNFVLQNRLSGELAALKLLIYAIILIVVVVFKNAPALKPLRERFNLKALLRKITKSHTKPGHISDDDAEWNRVETKIKMDELLSVDFQQKNTYTPDKKSKKEDK